LVEFLGFADNGNAKQVDSVIPQQRIVAQLEHGQPDMPQIMNLARRLGFRHFAEFERAAGGEQQREDRQQDSPFDAEARQHATQDSAGGLGQVIIAGRSPESALVIIPPAIMCQCIVEQRFLGARHQCAPQRPEQEADGIKPEIPIRQEPGDETQRLDKRGDGQYLPPAPAVRQRAGGNLQQDAAQRPPGEQQRDLHHRQPAQAEEYCVDRVSETQVVAGMPQVKIPEEPAASCLDRQRG